MEGGRAPSLVATSLSSVDYPLRDARGAVRMTKMIRTRWTLVQVPYVRDGKVIGYFWEQEGPTIRESYESD